MAGVAFSLLFGGQKSNGGGTGVDITEVNFGDLNLDVTYSGTTGAVVQGTGTVEVNSESKAITFEFPIPIIAGDDITIDATEEADALIIKVGETVEITTPAEATQGTISDADLSLLQASINNRIKLNRGDANHNEYFALSTDNSTDGTLCYSHIEYENSTMMIKTITITINTKAWVLHEVSVS